MSLTLEDRVIKLEAENRLLRDALGFLDPPNRSFQMFVFINGFTEEEVKSIFQIIWKHRESPYTKDEAIQALKSQLTIPHTFLLDDMVRALRWSGMCEAFCDLILGPKNPFNSFEELVETIKNGEGVEFSYNRKVFYISNHEDNITFTQEAYSETERVYHEVSQIGEYLIEGVLFRTLVEKKGHELSFRCF